MTRRTPAQFLFGTFAGWALLFTSAALVIIFTCSAMLSVAEDLAVVANLTTERTTYANKLWESWGYFIDPGAQSGVDSAGQHSFRLFVIIFFSLLGFTWVLMAFGIFIEILGVCIQNLRRQYSCIATRDHILVLGWTGKTLFLIGELAQMLTDGDTGGGTICVFGDIDTMEMAAEVAVAYRDFRERWPRVQLLYWRGKSHEVDDLERVSVTSAKCIVVLGASRDPREADSLVISTLCALQCLPTAPKAEVVVEIALPQNVGVARRLGGACARTITAKTAMDELVALMMRSATSGRAMVNLMSFDDQQFELVPAAQLVADHAKYYGGDEGAPCTFGSLRRSLRKGVLLGVRRPASTLGRHASDSTGGGYGIGGAFVARSPKSDKLGSIFSPPRLFAGPSADLLTEQGEVQATFAAGGVSHLAPMDSFTVYGSDQLIVIADCFKDAKLARSFAEVERMQAGGGSVAEASHSAWRAPMSMSSRTRVCIGNVLRSESSQRPPSQQPPSQRRADSRLRNCSDVVCVGEGGDEPTPEAEDDMPQLELTCGAAEGGSAPRTAAPALAPPSCSTSSCFSSFATLPTETGGDLPPQKARERNAYLLVGWVNGLDSLLRAIDRRVPPGSEVFLLSEKTWAWRERQLANGGMALDGSALDEESASATHGADDEDVAAGMIEDGDAGGGATGAGAAQAGTTGFQKGLTCPRARKPASKGSSGGSGKAGGTGGAGGGAGGEVGGRAGGGAGEGLINVRLQHIVGVPTDDGALKRLPLERAAAAIVSADVDTEDVDTQITDSEVITSAHILMEIYVLRAAREFERTGVRRPPLTLITEFHDVLTKRLLDLQPALLQPDNDDDDGFDESPAGVDDAGAAAAARKIPVSAWVDVLPFHRMCFETSALSISAYSHAGWVMTRRLLDAAGGVDVRSYKASRVLEADELCADDHLSHQATGVGGTWRGGSSSGRAAVLGRGRVGGQAQLRQLSEGSDAPVRMDPGLSFYELAARVSAMPIGHGILIGWHRGGEEPCINPKNKEEPLKWRKADRLIVVTPQAVKMGSRKTRRETLALGAAVGASC